MDVSLHKAKFATEMTLDASHEQLAASIEKIDQYPDRAVWIHRLDATQIRAQLDAALDRQKRGIAQPLLGWTFAIKDNIDLAGHPTTAACPAFSNVPQKSATVVQKLLDAGAIAVGKTNLDQFATGLVGTRSPYGIVKNAFDPNYIAGGSSSGSGVAVGAGLVRFSLGTDTAGSGRVPAAFNNIIGLKPTRGLVSAAGVVPACQSLDCVSIFASNCDDARAILNVVEGFDLNDPYSRRRFDLPVARSFTATDFKFGLPRKSQLNFFGDAEAEALYFGAVEALKRLGGKPVIIDYEPFERAAQVLYGGPWVAERLLAAKDLYETNPDALHPVTRSILSRAEKMTAVETFKALHDLESLRHLTHAEMSRVDCLLLPTTPTIYTIAQVEADPVQLNTNLGTYTNFVNLLDMSALAVPAGFKQIGVPLGVTLIAPAGQESSLLNVGDALHRSMGTGSGVTKSPLPQKPAAPPRASVPARIELAVVGAHLSGMPLNWQLTERGATLIRSTTTSPDYKFFALPGTVPPKPGLVRVESGKGHRIALEIWSMPTDQFGSFVALIPAPLGIGTLKLDDGSTVQGFICEPYATQGAEDISHHGGWRAYIASKK